MIGLSGLPLLSCAVGVVFGAGGGVGVGVVSVGLRSSNALLISCQVRGASSMALSFSRSGSGKRLVFSSDCWFPSTVDFSHGSSIEWISNIAKLDGGGR